MGAGSLIDEETQRKIAKILYLAGALFALLILAVWVVLLLNVSGAITWPQKLATSTAFLVFGLSVALACAVIWFLNRITILSLADSTEAMISKMLIASILGTVGTAIAKAFT